MMVRLLFRLSIAVALLALAAPRQLLAVSCTTQAQMTAADRDALAAAAKGLALGIQSASVDAVRSQTIPEVARQFTPIANTIQQAAPLMSGAVLTIDAMYGLDASGLKSAEETQFFCGSEQTVQVEITIPGLPPGQYALALVHATGVAEPQQMALLLQKNARWELAGLFLKPMRIAGHDSVWYWRRAREFAAKNQKWNAYFYYATAAYLATPASFLRSPNLDKLHKEMASVTPDNLPGAQPMTLQAAGQTYAITDLHTDAALGGFDLVIHYRAADTSDPVATRTHIVDVMKAMLQAHPELRDGFHGLWVFADAPGQQPFGVELPMDQISQGR